MRIIVRYCLPGGDINTQVVEIDSNANVDELQGMIAHRFNLSRESQSLRLKEDGIPVFLLYLTVFLNRIIVACADL